MNHAVYLNYLELARFSALEEGGFPPQTLEENRRAIHMVRVEVDYLKPTFQGQILRVRTQVERFRNTSMTIVQEIHRLVDGPIGDEPEEAGLSQESLDG